jgi:hypothetical protein
MVIYCLFKLSIPCNYFPCTTLSSLLALGDSQPTLTTHVLETEAYAATVTRKVHSVQAALDLDHDIAFIAI